MLFDDAKLKQNATVNNTILWYYTKWEYGEVEVKFERLPLQAGNFVTSISTRISHRYLT